MKRHLLTLLRLSIAALGVAFIVWSLTWADQLVVPADHAILAERGVTVDQPVTLRVVAGPGRSADGRWHAQLPADLGEQVVRVAPEAVGPQPGQVRYEAGVPTTLSEARWGWLAVGLVLMGMQPLIHALRWRLLMRCRGLDPGYVKSLRLTMVGLFFNFSLPGMTGGDVVKAYYAAKGSGAGSTAVMSVIFDRVTGMTGLIVLAALAGTAGLLMLEQRGLAHLTLATWVGLLALVFGGRVYLSRRVRRGLGIGTPQAPGAAPGALEMLRKVDQAAAAYRDHMPTMYLAVGLSVLSQLPQMIAVGWAGQALGMETSLVVLVAVLPLVFLAGTLPISYQGLGVMEAVAIALLLAPPEATANQVVGMLVVARLYMISYALLGAAALLRGDMHMFPQNAEALLAEPGAGGERADAQPVKT